MQPIFVVAVLFLTIGGQIEFGDAGPTNGAKDFPPEFHSTTTAMPTSSTTTPASKNVTTIVPPSGNITTTAEPTSSPTHPTTKAPTSTSQKPKTSTSTEYASTASSTPKVNPDMTTAEPQPPSEPGKKSGFDGVSFMGGILASVAILGVAGLSYKFYQIRTERSYHTL